MGESISLALQGVWGHKLRSFLTMLGIIIGIASIITIVSTIRGTNEQIKESLLGAGNNAVIIKLHQDNSAYELDFNNVPTGIYPISEETRQQLADIDHVQDVSLCLMRSYVDSVYSSAASFNGNLWGVDEHTFPVYGFSISYGRDFLPEDFSQARKVCILDSTASNTLFCGACPLGRTVEIRGEPFTVVGVVDKDRTVTMEIKTPADYYRYVDTNGGYVFIPNKCWAIFRFDEPQSAILRADKTDNMSKIGQTAGEILSKSQINRSDAVFSYRGQDLMEQAKKLQELSSSSNRQLIWIASISLLVGGIGVMNIMLVTVTERTQEIGLKKAIGAKRKRILWQFLTEAAVLTSLGGLLGVGVGIFMARLISSVMGTPTSISVPAILVAVIFSIVIGVLFGLLPALKASKLNPIQALRRL